MAKKTRTSTKSKSNKKAAARSNKKAAARPALLDQPLRDHLLYLLRGGGAHANFDDAMGDWPVQLAGAKVANFPHTAWMLLEHLRLAQWDILEFSRNSKHVSPAWPEGYWPASEAPADEQAWKASIAAFKKDLRTMEKLVCRPKSRSLCADSLGRWANHSARGAAGGRPQCVSPRTTGDAAEEHRNLILRSKLEHRRDAENAERFLS